MYKIVSALIGWNAKAPDAQRRAECALILVELCNGSDINSYTVRDMLLEANALPEACLQISLYCIKDEVWKKEEGILFLLTLFYYSLVDKIPQWNFCH